MSGRVEGRGRRRQGIQGRREGFKRSNSGDVVRGLDLEPFLEGVQRAVGGRGRVTENQCSIWSSIPRAEPVD